MAQLLRPKPIPAGPPAAVRRVVDEIVALTRQLQATGLSGESLADLIEPVFEEKLASHLRVWWVRKRRSADTTPTLTALDDLMSEEADISEETEAHPFAARMAATASARPATSTPPRTQVSNALLAPSNVQEVPVEERHPRGTGRVCGEEYTTSS